VPDRFEAEGRAFFERVRSAYARLAQDEPERVKLVDGVGSIEQIRKTLEQHLELDRP
jgi:dTMP kinase